ncbi:MULTISPECIES: hypothetical protein [Rummeliibacillus]|uniref:hypothetical protein n=1 Tax=Rummeliibacillus TaxID=648802 RepID=UPI0011B77D0A|nr:MULTISPECIES: hypothetical protein [Rummeliibacillus]MBO2536509.1 hypothetical protein [Rummeliibacillus suwonensis]
MDVNKNSGKNPSVLTEDELAVYEFALRDEFNGMHIPPEKQEYYLEKILKADEEGILHLRKKGAIAISREVVNEGNIFGA